MNMRKLVGDNIRRIRRTKSVTQEEFAEKSGYSQQYISDLERGRRYPTVMALFELAGQEVSHMKLVRPKRASCGRYPPGKVGHRLEKSQEVIAIRRAVGQPNSFRRLQLDSPRGSANRIKGSDQNSNPTFAQYADERRIEHQPVTACRLKGG